LIFSNGSYKREDIGRDSTISRDEFLEFTKSVWTFPAESARRVGHPAPFPLELPYRLIQLYTFIEDVILDPFIGSGQSAISAVKTGRHYVGYEINEQYAKLARDRINDFQYTHCSPQLF
jgi:site-specific DNA-methyltransferase (adenine-specific)